MTFLKEVFVAPDGREKAFFDFSEQEGPLWQFSRGASLLVEQ